MHVLKIWQMLNSVIDILIAPIFFVLFFSEKTILHVSKKILKNILFCFISTIRPSNHVLEAPFVRRTKKK